MWQRIKYLGRFLRKPMVVILVVTVASVFIGNRFLSKRCKNLDCLLGPSGAATRTSTPSPESFAPTPAEILSNATLPSISSTATIKVPIKTSTPTVTLEPGEVLSLLNEIDYQIAELDEMMQSAEFAQPEPYREDYDLCPKGKVTVTNFYHDSRKMIQYDLNCLGHFQVAQFEFGEEKDKTTYKVYDTDGNGVVNFMRLDSDISGKYEDYEICTYEPPKNRWLPLTFKGISCDFPEVFGVPVVFPLLFFYP